jgi:nucleotide-binding universal stress UspA family protein
VTSAYVVGFSPDDGGREALSLGGLLASGTGAVLHVCTVIADRHPFATLPGVDAEYVATLRERARTALDEATRSVDGVPMQRHIQPAPSAAAGLGRFAHDVGAQMIVVGSGREGLWRLIIGSTTDDLLHSAPLPVAMATRGFRAPASSLQRVSCGIAGGPGRTAAVGVAVRLARSHGVPLRLVTLLVHDQQMGQAGVGFDAERAVLAEWRTQVIALHADVRAEIGVDIDVESAVQEGRTWEEALDALGWTAAEVLVIGPGRRGRAQRLFLGGHANKITRSSPVPVVAAPSDVDEER